MSVSASQGGKELYEFGPFRVDPEKETLLRAGEPVPLTPKTFQILLVLVRHSKEVVTKDDLMKTVWPDTFVEEANLSRNIFMLRKALGESPQDHQVHSYCAGTRLSSRRECALATGAGTQYCCREPFQGAGTSRANETLGMDFGGCDPPACALRRHIPVFLASHDSSH